MSEPEEEVQLHYGFQKDTLHHIFAAAGHVWWAQVMWTGGYQKSKDFVSSYDGKINMHGIKQQIEEIGKLTINAVRMIPTRFSSIHFLKTPHVVRADMKGGTLDCNPWFFRKAVPPLKFYSRWSHSESRFDTLVETEGDGELTPTQKIWVKDNITVCLDSQWNLTLRAEFLWTAKQAFIAKFKDGLISDAFERMTHFRNLAEAIDRDYDSLVVHPAPTPAP